MAKPALSSFVSKFFKGYGVFEGVVTDIDEEDPYNVTVSINFFDGDSET